MEANVCDADAEPGNQPEINVLVVSVQSKGVREPCPATLVMFASQPNTLPLPD
jgi:hypothetical protein